MLELNLWTGGRQGAVSAEQEDTAYAMSKFAAGCPTPAILC